MGLSVPRIIKAVTNSIAFFPSLIASVFSLFAIFMIYFEYTQFSMEIKENISILLVKGSDNARQTLGVLIGGIFSLTVFSFSMVMIVLSQASSNFTPRVIPGLITKKDNQVVLGFYIGTIIYNLVLIINIDPNNDQVTIPSLGIFFGMILGISCLALFVFFIHSISQSIQIDTILDDIYQHTRNKLKACDSNENERKLVMDSKKWYVLRSREPGYLKSINSKKLVKLAEKEGLEMEMQIPLGFFLVAGYPLLRINKDISSNEALEKEIFDYFIFYIEEFVSDHYIYGFKQISEVAVKALSTGINDPGTAIKAIDMLSVLYITKMKIKEDNFGFDEKGKLRLIKREIPFDQLLYEHLSPIRKYGNGDMMVMFNLLEGLKNILYADKAKKRYHNVVLGYIMTTLEDVDQNIKNNTDRKQINKIVVAINRLADEGKSISLLSTH